MNTCKWVQKEKTANGTRHGRRIPAQQSDYGYHILPIFSDAKYSYTYIQIYTLIFILLVANHTSRSLGILAASCGNFFRDPGKKKKKTNISTIILDQYFRISDFRFWYFGLRYLNTFFYESYSSLISLFNGLSH